MAKIKLTIEGMHCAGCAANVERIVRKVRGVKEANVSLMINKCFIEADNANLDEIKNAVKKIGYKVTEVEEE